MSDKYIITKEEINQILLHSPYALSLAPSKNGMSGEQTKKYFYDFIPVLVEKLNFKMKDVELSEIANEKMVDEIWEAINTLGADIVSAMSKATQAYNLASGKSKVYVWGNVRHLFGDILNSLNNEANNLRVGDFILITEKGFPDFIVSSSPDDVKIPPNGYVSVTAENYLDVEIKEGTTYAFLNGFSLIGIESGIDTSVFATKEELTSQINEAKGSAESAMEMAQSAYNVASGKRAVHYEQTMQFAFLHLCYDSESLNDGDMIVIGAKGVPDLIVFKSAEPLQGATIVARSQIEENTLPEIVPGGKYRLDVGENGKYIGFVAIESSTNIDTSVFATKEELSDIASQKEEMKLVYVYELKEGDTPTNAIDVYLDKPYKEAYVMCEVLCDKEATNTPFGARTLDSRQNYLFYNRMESPTTAVKYFYFHTKEIVEREWLTVYPEKPISNLYGESEANRVCKISRTQRREGAERYPSSLRFLINTDAATNFVAGTKIKVYVTEGVNE